MTHLHQRAWECPPPWQEWHHRHHTWATRCPSTAPSPRSALRRRTAPGGSAPPAAGRSHCCCCQSLWGRKGEEERLNLVTADLVISNITMQTSGNQQVTIYSFYIQYFTYLYIPKTEEIFYWVWVKLTLFKWEGKTLCFWLLLCC